MSTPASRRARRAHDVGASAVEYALLIAAIVTLVVVAVIWMGSAHSAPP